MKKSTFRGITLLEILIAVPLISVVTLGAWGIYNAGLSFFSSTLRQGQITQDVSFAMEHIIKEIREKGIKVNQPSSVGSSGSTLDVNVDTDGDLSTAEKRIRYELIDSQIKYGFTTDLTQPTPSEVIATGIKNLTFTHREDGTSALKSIEIVIELTKADKNIKLHSRAKL